MKVLVLVDNLTEGNNKSGAWGHAVEQILELSKECDIKVISPECITFSMRKLKKNWSLIKNRFKSEYNLNGIPCWRPKYIDFSFLPWKFRRHYLQIWTTVISCVFLILRKNIKFDVIHAHFVYRPGYIASILGKIFRKPVIITAHGSDIHQNLFTDKEDRIFRKKTISALRQSSRIIAVSRYLKEIINREKINKEITVVPCGFSERQVYLADKEECRKNLSINTGKKIILFVGVMEDIKGADVLIRAFKILQEEVLDSELLIIGSGSRKNFLEQLVLECKVSEKVVFLGQKDKKSVYAYMNSADVVVVPSRDEGRSLVVIEALACGKPVVASRVGGIKETITNDELGILVEKESPQALAEGIIRTMGRSWDSAFILNYARTFANNRIIPQILKVYREVYKYGKV